MEYINTYGPVLISILILTMISVSLEVASWNARDSRLVQTTTKYRNFKLKFFPAYLLACGSDWLQGPYIYKLYSSYGFSGREIGQLFSIGYLSSLIFGTYIGGMADYYGRKNSCALFCLFYGLSCFTKHSRQFSILMLGRVLSGVSTSLLNSSFEAWMVHEHDRLKFPPLYLNKTFQLMSFGKSFVAILSGVLGSLISSYASIVHVFDAAILFLCVSLTIITIFWKENYGQQCDYQTEEANGFQKIPDRAMWSGQVRRSDSWMTSSWVLYKEAITFIVTDLNVMLLYLSQSGFESAMYIFVFHWTKTLEISTISSISSSLRSEDSGKNVQGMMQSTAAVATPRSFVPITGTIRNNNNNNMIASTFSKHYDDMKQIGEIPYGFIFSSFMLSLMIGSQIFKIVQYRHHWVLCIVIFISGLSLSLPMVQQTNFEWILISFIIFECCCGFYYPSIGTLRSQIIPSKMRSTLITLSRVGLNIIVIMVLLNNTSSDNNDIVDDDNSSYNDWLPCVVLLAISTVSMIIFNICKIYNVNHHRNSSFSTMRYASNKSKDRQSDDMNMPNGSLHNFVDN